MRSFDFSQSGLTVFNMSGQPMACLELSARLVTSTDEGYDLLNSINAIHNPRGSLTLDKLHNIYRTVQYLDKASRQIL